MFDESEWTSDYVPPTDKKILPELDLDRRPAPSGCIFTDSNCQMVVRDWGLVVISEKGVCLQGRTLLPPGTVESWGKSFR
jgi:hypothetical protein